jgi:hypothetical protein
VSEDYVSVSRQDRTKFLTVVNLSVHDLIRIGVDVVHSERRIAIYGRRESQSLSEIVDHTNESVTHSSASTKAQSDQNLSRSLPYDSCNRCMRLGMSPRMTRIDFSATSNPRVRFLDMSLT